MYCDKVPKRKKKCSVREPDTLRDTDLLSSERTKSCCVWLIIGEKETRAFICWMTKLLLTIPRFLLVQYGTYTKSARYYPMLIRQGLSRIRPKTRHVDRAMSRENAERERILRSSNLFNGPLDINLDVNIVNNLPCWKLKALSNVCRQVDGCHFKLKIRLSYNKKFRYLVGGAIKALFC